ncbi:MAG: 3-phosphoshikimate 1-carboxyvinyltransferase [Treponema sp.]|jgi:3-phosphoshikimate 1-carboxyvinyltransferase|nr:3-phosphoshikimate 1-carboxyvinyltransferase [Treponema sp.]
MNVRIQPGQLNGVVQAIPSKSQAHRALVCAALADAPTQINCKGESEDISASIDCLTALGADIRRDTGRFSVIPLNKNVCEGDASLPCGESGSTFRFLLPVAGALGRSASFLLKGQLPKRPLSPLDDELTAHGCVLSPQGSNPFRITGQLAPGKYALNAGVSSQFISGLLFALPLLGEDSELRLLGKVESFPYIELTMAMLKLFGVHSAFNTEGEVFSIPGGQTYHSPGEVSVEGDWSNAAFWLSAGAIGEESVTCAGLDLQSPQGDRAILDILAQFGSRVETDANKAAVSGGKLHGIEIDAQNIPDLVPILAVAATAAEGTTVIRNAGRLRTKESDRLAAVTDVLRGLGANVKETEDGLVINGCALTGGNVSSWGDHRIAMSAAIAATVCREPVVIRDAEAVNKSYPGFFDDMQKLGGSVHIMT